MLFVTEEQMAIMVDMLVSVICKDKCVPLIWLARRRLLQTRPSEQTIRNSRGSGCRSWISRGKTTSGDASRRNYTITRYCIGPLKLQLKSLH